jgi:sigma-E factor negative regulatory protein RseB
MTRMQNIGGASGPVRHLVLSDGLASVSVFIEPMSAGNEPKGISSADNKVGKSATAIGGSANELARVGSALAYSTEAEEHRITAVGEVPANTLRAIATSVQRTVSDEKAPPKPTNAADASSAAR